MSGKQRSNSSAKGRAALKSELAYMISDLNEARMRLDALLRKIPADVSAPDPSDPGAVQARRIQIAARLDRIRDKLLMRLSDAS